MDPKMSLDDKVQAYLEMVLVQVLSGAHESTGLVVVRDPDKDEVKQGVALDVGPEVPTLISGDTVYFCGGYEIESLTFAVHFSDIIAYKRLYFEE